MSKGGGRRSEVEIKREREIEKEEKKKILRTFPNKPTSKPST